MSVIVPCYNYGRYLEGCAESILSQNGVEIDLLIINDASSDETGEVARRLAATDRRVNVITHGKNVGHIATYNEGLGRSAGDYLVLLSADDQLAPGWLGRATGVLESHPEVGLVYGDAPSFNTVPPLPSQLEPRWDIQDGRRWVEGRCSEGINPIHSPEAVLRRSLYESIGPYRPELPHAADFAMWLLAAARSRVGVMSGPPAAYYRVHVSNMHRAVFAGHQAAGMMTDLEQRYLAFEVALVGAPLAEAEQLWAQARRSLARDALRAAARAYYRSWGSEWPVNDLVSFAFRAWPDAARLSEWRSLRRRYRLVSAFPRLSGPGAVPALPRSARMSGRPGAI